MDNSSTYTDSRGTITDLLVGDGFSVTHITFNKDAIRGNHYHEYTHQYDICLKGNLLANVKGKNIVFTPMSRLSFNPNEAHAYKGLADESEILSICFGKRIGTDYEKDVVRLKEPLL